MPKVSIVIPTLNRPEYLHACITSCLGQTFSDIEVIVVDNASDDPVAAKLVFEAFSDVRLKYVRYEERLDAAGSWSRALSLATGFFGKVMCDDDLLAPEYLEIGLKSFEFKPEAVLFTCAWRRSEAPEAELLNLAMSYDCLWIPPEAIMILSYLDVVGGGLPTLTLFKMDEIRRLEPVFNSDKYYDSCDSACWIKLLMGGGLISCQAELAVERIHPRQAQQSWTIDHYRKVFLALKSLIWSGFSPGLRNQLVTPERYVEQLALLMRISGHFQRKFRFKDLRSIIGCVRILCRFRKRSKVQDINRMLAAFNIEEQCEVIEISLLPMKPELAR